MATASSTDRMRPKTFACGLSAGGAVWARGGVGATDGGSVGGGAGAIGGVGETGGGGAGVTGGEGVGVTGGVWACATLLAATRAAHPTAHSVTHDLMERLPWVPPCPNALGLPDRAKDNTRRRMVGGR